MMINNNVQVRVATENDSENMVAFLSDLHSERLDTVTQKPVPTLDEESAFIQRAARGERAFLLIAHHNEKVIGLLDQWANSAPETRHSAHFGMSVAKSRRNQGVGRQLLQSALDRVREWEGFCRLELEFVVWNEPAIRLYETLGFKLEGRKVKAINLRGRPEDMLIMALTW